MNKEKASFAYVSVRFYDISFLKELENYFEIHKGEFDSSKSKFIAYLALVGFESLKKANSKKENDAIRNDVSDTKEILEGLAIYLNNEITSIRCELEVLEKLLASSQKLILDLADGRKIDLEMLERGFLDKIPKRFEDHLLNGIAK